MTTQNIDMEEVKRILALGKMPTIGGLPAHLFAGRAVKLRLHDGRDKNPTLAHCLGVQGDYIRIRRRDGVETHSEPKHVYPWWTRNPDLKVMAEALAIIYDGKTSVGRAFEEALKADPSWDDVETDDSEPSAPIKPMVLTTPELPTTTAPTATKSGIAEIYRDGKKLVAVRVAMDCDPTWKVSFDTLQECLTEVTEARKRVAEANKDLRDKEGMVNIGIEELQQKRVTLEWQDVLADNVWNATYSSPTPPPPPREFVPAVTPSAARAYETARKATQDRIRDVVTRFLKNERPVNVTADEALRRASVDPDEATTGDRIVLGKLFPELGYERVSESGVYPIVYRRR